MKGSNLNSQEFMEELLNTASPAGREDEARILLHRYLAPYAQDFHTDVIGNSYAVINPQASYKVMITGHQDEIAAQIIRIDERGFLSIRNSGFPNWLRLAGCQMEVITARGDRVPAVLLNRITSDVSDASFSCEKMYLDIGAQSKKEAEDLVAVGDYVVSSPNFRRLAGNRFISKALDDKLGVYIAAEAFRKIAQNPPKDVGVYFVGASQEELGSRGARAAAYAIAPQVGIAIDVSHAMDFPGANTDKYPDFALGRGIGIYRNANNTEALLLRALMVAEKNHIDYQLTPHYGAISSTDASVFQIVRGGCATLLMGIPNRYMHSQVEMADFHDVETGIELMAGIVGTLTPTDSFLPRID